MREHPDIFLQRFSEKALESTKYADASFRALQWNCQPTAMRYEFIRSR